MSHQPNRVPSGRRKKEALTKTTKRGGNEGPKEKKRKKKRGGGGGQKNTHHVADVKLQKREPVLCRCTVCLFLFSFFVEKLPSPPSLASPHPVPPPPPPLTHPRRLGVFAATKSKVVAACTAYGRHSKSHDPVPLQRGMSLQSTIPADTGT